MTLFLVRHGETPLNAARVFQFPDTPLSARGEDQARRVARRLAGEGVALVLASDYARARMTGEAIAEAAGAPLEIEPLLRERDFGDHRGRRHDELGLDPFAPDHVPPNGEGVADFEARVARAWEAVRRRAEDVAGALVVVSHGHVCRAVVAAHVDVGAGVERAPARWANTCVTVIDRRASWSARLVACAAHLDER